MKNKLKSFKFLIVLTVIAVLFAGCSPQPKAGYIVSGSPEPSPIPDATETPLSNRPVYAPGTLVDYVAQSGDSLDLLSVRFGASPQEILWANPEIPRRRHHFAAWFSNEDADLLQTALGGHGLSDHSRCHFRVRT